MLGLGDLALWEHTKPTSSVTTSESTMTEPRQDLDPATPDAASLENLVRDLEGSTHGGPRHFQVFDSLKRVVASDPQQAIEAMRDAPASGRAPILTALTALGRRGWPALEFAMQSSQPIDRHHGSMILYGLAVRGLVSRRDEPQVQKWLDDETHLIHDTPPDGCVEEWSEAVAGRPNDSQASKSEAAEPASEVFSDQVRRVLKRTLELLAARGRDAV